MADNRLDLISVGRVTGVFGIKGWVKVRSSTQPEENILGYKPWYLKTRHGLKEVVVEESQQRKQDFLVRFKDVTERNEAENYCRSDIAIDRKQLPKLDDGEYYWSQLIGLTVTSSYEQNGKVLGIVKSLIETGSNDVLVVVPSEESIDQRERLIPYVPEMYVRKIDIESQQIEVDWDPEF